MLALLLPQGFYLPLLMILHTDVYRYFIVDALLLALKSRTKQSTAAAGGFGGWGGFKVVQNSFYVHVPLMVFERGRTFYHDYYDYLFLLLVWRKLLLKKSALFIRKGPLK